MNLRSQSRQRRRSLSAFSDTFTFLGFTHIWGKSRAGKTVVRQVTVSRADMAEMVVAAGKLQPRTSLPKWASRKAARNREKTPKLSNSYEISEAYAYA
jgi:hypothetical protein